MFVIDRQRQGKPENPSEKLTIAGTTGNVYTITIGHCPSCDCPHARKGHQCKHIVFALIRVLKAPLHLQYQLAFLTTELQTIFANAPPIRISSEASKAAEEDDGSRKPIEGDCPICFTPLEADASGGDKPVYCKAACGNNFHTECFSQWAATKRASGSKVTCPLCRTEWQNETQEDAVTIRSMAQNGRPNEEGYVNLANVLGISGARDYSTYNSYWNYKRGGYRQTGSRRGGQDHGDYFGFEIHSILSHFSVLPLQLTPSNFQRNLFGAAFFD
jgi:hypothetical protein